jgi:DNA-binding MarR family transcriptional regulator
MPADLEILGRTLKQAQHRQHRTLDAALADIGTTLVQWDALRAVGNEPGASAHDLALATFQTDQSFGTLANRLEAQGLIRREPGEGRRIAHRLTAPGERLLGAANAIAARIRAELYAPLSDTDRRTLQGLLNRLLAG